MTLIMRLRSIIFMKNKDIYLIVAIFLMLTVSFAFINVSKFRVFSVTSFGWQGFYSYLKLAEGKEFSDMYIIPEYPSLTYLLAPLNIIIAFIYKFLHKPEILLIFQVIMMFGGCWPVYLIARHYLRNNYLSMALSISYLLNPIIITGAMLGYIPMSIGICFLLWAFYYLEKEDIKKFSFFILLANASKIDIIVMTSILGIILTFKENKSKFGRLILELNFIWLIILVFVGVFCFKIKHFPSGLLHFDKYGGKITDSLRYILHNPLVLANNMFNDRNMLCYIFIGLPAVFSFFSFFYLLPVIPEIAYIVIRNQHSSGHILIISFIFFGSIYGIGKLSGVIKEFSVKYLRMNMSLDSIYTVVASLILVAVPLRHYYFIPKSDFGENLGPIPFTRNFNLKFYIPTHHVAIGYRLLEKIPNDTSCLTTPALASHLSRCRFLGIFNRDTVVKSYNWDYIFLDLYKDDYYPLSRKEAFLRLKKYLTKERYGVVSFEEGWLLLMKSYCTTNNDKVLTYLDRLLSDGETN